MRELLLASGSRIGWQRRHTRPTEAHRPSYPTLASRSGRSGSWGGWAALVACVVTTLLAAGTRSSLAAFLRPIEADLALDRATLAAAGALTVLAYGLAQPAAGSLAARYGARQVMMAGAALMAASGLGVALATDAWHLFLFVGILPGLGFAAASSVPAMALLAQWFHGRLGLATGVLSSAIPAGQALFVPVAAALIPVLGWRSTYVVLGLLLVVVALPVLHFLAHPPARPVGAHAAAQDRPLPAMRVRLDVWLVGAGYFVCGFTDQFVSLHLVALATEAGFEPLAAAAALSALLLIAIVGSVLSGPLADTVRPYQVLAGLYLTRAVALPLLLLTGPGVLGYAAIGIFALLFGLTYISNQAPGARLVRDGYGVRAVGPLMGRVGLAHQVGGAAGVMLGGVSVALAGDYGPSVVAAAGLALVGGLLQLGIPRAQRAQAG